MHWGNADDLDFPSLGHGRARNGAAGMTCPAYDFARKRWTCKGTLRRWSHYVAGRMATHQELLAGRPVTVSAYATQWGDRYFTDPVNPKHKAGPGVLYRINVRPKC